MDTKSPVMVLPSVRRNVAEEATHTTDNRQIRNKMVRLYICTMGLNIKWETAKKENLLLKNRQLPFYSVNISGIPLETLFFNR